MTDTPAHTPLPWEAQALETDGDIGVSIVGSDLGGLVCAALPWPTEIDSGDYSRVEANAAFIVRACNNHYQLVEALLGLLDEVAKSPCADSIILDSVAAGHAFAALSQAGGE